MEKSNNAGHEKYQSQTISARGVRSRSCSDSSEKGNGWREQFLKGEN
jgi:hypothetical protein